MDRSIFVGLYRLVPNTIKALTLVKPDTVIRWHRAGFRSYWRWKSRHRGGRPTVPLEIGELLKLGMNSWRSPEWIGVSEWPSYARPIACLELRFNRRLLVTDGILTGHGLLLDLESA